MDSNILKKILTTVISLVVCFCFIAVALIISQRGYVTANNSATNRLIDEDTWYQVKNINAGTISASSNQCLLIYDKSDTDSVNIMENMQYTLSVLNVNVDTMSVVVYEDLDSTDDEQITTVIGTSAPSIYIDYLKYQDIVICLSSFSSIGIDVNQLYTWCSHGGNLMFAGGIDDTVDVSTWGNILGINTQEEAPLVLADSLQFNTDLLVGVNGMEFSDDVISCEVIDFTLNDDCTLHISTSDELETPLLWEHPCENGKVIVCNTILMDAKNDRGIIASAYCRFYPIYVYPVINACTYCIDDYPSPSPAGYDSNIVSQYGYTVSDFLSNVWLPSMETITEKYGIKFSSFAIETYENDVESPFNNVDNELSAKYYASRILYSGGEVGIHGYNHQPLVLEGYKLDKENAGYTPWFSIQSMIESINSVISYTENLADDLEVTAYVAPSNVISNEAFQGMLSEIENIRVYAGIYMGTEDQFIQEYEVLDNGVVLCPRLTADMQMEDSEWWTQINELNFHYVESNFIHPDDILDEERSDGGDFNQMLSGYCDMIEWNQSQGLRETTISECGASVQRYCNLTYEQTLTDDELMISVDGLIDTAYMMLRTNDKRPVSVTGATLQEISADVYILEITDSNIVVKLVDKE